MSYIQLTNENLAELSADDLAYYAEAMGRISGKLLKASKMI